MITKIQGEQPFQVLTNNFSISPSNEGYTLQISADGKQYSNLFSVGAGVTRLVTGVAANSYYRLLGNNSQVSVNWMKSCVTEGGGGEAGGNELVPQDSLPETADAGTVVALTSGGVYQYDGTNWNELGGGDLSDYWNSGETMSAITSATSGKADKGNVPGLQVPNAGSTWFPIWNQQGIITGLSQKSWAPDTTINGKLKRYLEISGNGDVPPIWAPQSAGNAGEILVSIGSGAPVWSAVTSNTEEIELPIAAAINDVRDTFAVRLDQQYYKKQEVNDIAARKTDPGQVNVQIKDYVDPAIAEVNDTIADKELPVSAALNKLNEDIATIDEVIPAAIVDINDRMVSSSTVKTIWRGSQSDYDAITVKDAATLYIII